MPHILVMRGLDPRIHDEMQQKKSYVGQYLFRIIMDCRVKPGNDGVGGTATNSEA